MSAEIVREEFASMAAFVDYCNGASDMASYTRSSRRLDEGRKGFHGSPDWDTANQLAFGWDEGAARIERQRVNMTPKGQKNRRVATLREVGPGTISMGNYLAGHPQPYVVLQETNTAKRGKGKIVRIAVNISASGMVDTSVIERRGGAILALVDALERAGRRCEITVVIANAPKRTSSEAETSCFRVTAKQAHERLNLNTLAFMLAHASMYRRFGFSAFERQSPTWRLAHRIGMGYGSVINGPKCNADIFLGCLFGLDEQWKTEEAAQAWVIKELEAQGVKLR